MQQHQHPELNKLRPFPYRNSRAKETLAMMNTPTGILCYGGVKYRLEQDQGFHFRDELDNKSGYQPAKLYEALAKYASNDVEPEFDKLAWDQAYAATLAYMTLQNPVRPLRTAQQLTQALKLEKFSGAPEFKSKGEVMHKELRRSLRWLRGEVSAQPCVAMHRVQHGSNGPKTRLVWAYPQSVTIAEARFARPLIDAFKKKDSPMAFGKYRYQIGARMTTIENSHAIYGLDMSGFDQSICRKLIHMAFQILSKSLDMTWEEEKMWEKVEHYFIHTPILMPDGNVYTKHRGVPSGSYFTQLVDSIVNHFCIQYVWYIMFNRTIYRENILVLGDDSLFGVPYAVSLRKLAVEFKKIGLTIHEDVKSFMTLDHKIDAHFLGHEWTHGLVDREPRDVAMRMVYPERFVRVDDPKTLVATRMFQFVADAKSAHTIYKGWSRYDGNDMYALYTRDDVDLSMMDYGWKVFQQSQGIDNPATSTYAHACSGIFK